MEEAPRKSQKDLRDRGNRISARKNRGRRALWLGGEGRTERAIRGLIARRLQGCKTERKCDERRDCSTGECYCEEEECGGDCSGAPLHICVSHRLNSPEV